VLIRNSKIVGKIKEVIKKMAEQTKVKDSHERQANCWSWSIMR